MIVTVARDFFPFEVTVTVVVQRPFFSARTDDFVTRQIFVYFFGTETVTFAPRGTFSLAVLASDVPVTVRFLFTRVEIFCERPTFTVGAEWVNPVAKTFSQPSDSLMFVIAVPGAPSSFTTDTNPVTGASVNP